MMDTGNKNLLIGGAILIGGAVVFTKVLKPLMGGLGLDDPEDTNTVESVSTQAPEDNPFSINFSSGLHGQSPTAYGADFFRNLKTLYENGQGSGGVLNIAVNGENIENAFGVISEWDSNVESVINSLASQADVANLASYIYYNYGDDLYSLMKHGKGVLPFVSKGMTTSRLASLVNHINSLPLE